VNDVNPHEHSPEMLAEIERIERQLANDFPDALYSRSVNFTLEGVEH
jgi:hypothetical protein